MTGIDSAYYRAYNRGGPVTGLVTWEDVPGGAGLPAGFRQLFLRLRRLARRTGIFTCAAFQRWQRAAAACLDASACTSLLSDLDPASRALMLSQAGPGGSRALTALPTAPEFRLPSSCFRVVLLRRLRLPVPIGPRRCRCGGALDALGDHRTACPTAGVLGARGAALERAAARVCREAGARVATNVFLRDMNVDVPLADGRRIEVLANGLPLWQGAQAAVDTTLVSPVTRAGGAQPQADRVPGNALEQAAKRTRLHNASTHTRFGLEAVAFLRQLARARARESPARLRPAVQRASVHRWTGMLAVAAQRALAYSLLELPLAAADECDGTEPSLGDLLADARDTEPEHPRFRTETEFAKRGVDCLDDPTSGNETKSAKRGEAATRRGEPAALLCATATAAARPVLLDRPFRERPRAGAGEVVVLVCIDLSPTAVSAFGATVQGPEICEGARAAEGGASLRRAASRVQGWTLRPKSHIPDASGRSQGRVHPQRPAHLRRVRKPTRRKKNDRAPVVSLAGSLVAAQVFNYRRDRILVTASIRQDVGWGYVAEQMLCTRRRAESVRRDKAMASSAPCRACAQAATLIANANGPSDAASSRSIGLRPSRAWKCAELPNRVRRKKDLLKRSALRKFDGRCAQRMCRSPCRVRERVSVAALPGATAAAVSSWRAREGCPRRTFPPGMMLSSGGPSPASGCSGCDQAAEWGSASGLYGRATALRLVPSTKDTVIKHCELSQAQGALRQQGTIFRAGAQQEQKEPRALQIADGGQTGEQLVFMGQLGTGIPVVQNVLQTRCLRRTTARTSPSDLGILAIGLVQGKRPSIHWLQALVGLYKGIVLAKGIQGRGQRVALLAAFTLVDAPPGAGGSDASAVAVGHWARHRRDGKTTDSSRLAVAEPTHIENAGAPLPTDDAFLLDLVYFKADPSVLCPPSSVYVDGVSAPLV
ncbi:hypothetical protein AK812_SmicGene36766 [Symbiodinium microadriaticum]|uniref:Uncharacterized protein n=1 Tax=Symbiodinium microadriaticum TaxID=2951 RepID=A0A1Q9CI12_SYMMI|nr:hypothetical protein AK812_SmicGene36766 [Symbiodinium microadriaticum]